MNETNKYKLTLDDIKKLNHYFNNLELLYFLLEEKEDGQINFLLRNFISEYSEFIVRETEEMARVKSKSFDATCIFDGNEKVDVFKKAKLLIDMVKDGAFDKKFSFVDEQYKHEPIKTDNDEKVKNGNFDATSVLKNVDVEKAKKLMTSNEKSHLNFYNLENYAKYLSAKHDAKVTAVLKANEAEEVNSEKPKETNITIEEKVMKALKDMMRLADKEAEEIYVNDIMKFIGEKND